MPKPNSRFVDTTDTVAIKPIGSTASKDLVIEDIDMPLDKYLESLGLGNETSVARSDSETRHTAAIDRINQKYGLRISKSGN